MKKRILALLAAMAMSLSLVACGGGNDTPAAPEQNQPEASQPADSGNGKAETIKIICPYGVGGTADLVARKFAQVANRLHPEYNFIVENMTGGDGFAAATYYSEVDPAAKELLVFGYGVIYRHDLGKKFGTEIVEFDRHAMHPIGTVDDRTWILYAAPETTLADVIAKAQEGTLKMSGGNPLSDCHLALGSLCGQLGGKVMVVPYDGGAAQKKGLTDGEVDVFVGTTQAAVEDVAAGTLVPILAFSDRPFEGFVGPNGPIDLPTVAGETKAPELPADIDFTGSILPAGGTLGCRVGAPQEFIDSMTQVIKDTWNDEEFYGWTASVMLNRFEVYNEAAQKLMDEACEKAIAAFELLA